jgi:hypothetical protein
MDDKERLKKLRAKQLADRDPGESKIPGYDWKQHHKRSQHFADVRRRQENRPAIVKTWDILPTRYRGAIIGLVFGGTIAVILAFMLPAEWQLLAVVPILIGFIVGMVLGKVMQEEPY